MIAAAVARARWQRHPNAVSPPIGLKPWLALPTSLTARLRAHCREFRVQRLRQQRESCLADEATLIALPRSGRAWVREVLLCCDGKPVVFAHTVVPLAATATDWPKFRSLGENSLGATLFGDPLVTRGHLQFARLSPSHPLARRIGARIPNTPYPLYARRCLFARKNGLMLVTEVFLTGIETLSPLVN